MAIADLVYPADLNHVPCDCHKDDKEKECDCGQVAYFVPPPVIDVTKFPYPPIYPYPYPHPHHHHHHGEDGEDEEESAAKQSAVERQICKLSRKAGAIRALLDNLENKNKPLIVKSGAASYNFGSLKTKNEDGEEEENEAIATVIAELKKELNNIKEEI